MTFLKKTRILKPLIYQIVIGDTIPSQIRGCLKSVKEYAQAYDYDYACEEQMPTWALDLNMDARMASEWMRIDKLSERPYVLYVDWDIKLFKGFELGEEIITAPMTDSLLYFGSNIDIANRLKEKVGPPTANVMNGFAHYAFKDIMGNSWSKYFLKSSYYTHLMYHTLGVGVL